MAAALAGSATSSRMEDRGKDCQNLGLGSSYSWPHPLVAFTENGVLYDSKARQHSARRNQCKSWYNDDWLGRILAAMSFLAGEGKDEFTVPLSAKERLAVRRLPVMFESPVSFAVVEELPALEDEPHHEEEAGEDDETAEDGGEE